MASSRLNNRRGVETILVGKAGVALEGAGAALTAATGATNLLDGQIGVYPYRVSGTAATSVYGTAIDHTTAGATAAAVDRFVVAQGTVNVADAAAARRYPLAHKPYYMSSVIDKSRIISYTHRDYRAPKLNVWNLGNGTAAATDQINPLDEVEYSLKIAYRGRRVDEVKSSLHGRPSYTPSYTTPDYTTLGTTSPLDHLIKNLAFNINRNSIAFNQVNPSFGGNQEVIALAINSQQGAGATVAGATKLSAVAAGTPINVVTFGGVTRTYTPDAQFAATIADVVTATPGNIDGNSAIINIDLSGAGVAAAADGNAGVDQLLIIALDEYNLAFDDRIPEKKIRLDVGLFEGFDYPRTALDEVTRADEGEGTYDQWKKFFDDTEGQRWYSANRTEWPVLPNGDQVAGSNRLVPATNYEAIVILHDISSTAGAVGGTIVAPRKLIILIPDGEAAMTNLQTLFTNMAFPVYN